MVLKRDAKNSLRKAKGEKINSLNTDLKSPVQGQG
jgi:hypothetical protein